MAPCRYVPHPARVYKYAGLVFATAWRGSEKDYGLTFDLQGLSKEESERRMGPIVREWRRSWYVVFDFTSWTSHVGFRDTRGAYPAYSFSQEVKGSEYPVPGRWLHAWVLPG